MTSVLGKTLKTKEKIITGKQIKGLPVSKNFTKN
jgi:hypothetical protein